MEYLNSQLRNNICPRELNYNINNVGVDFNKLQYNSRYHSYDYYANKFPRNWGDNPLFSDLINIISNTAKMNYISPLQELNNISNNSIESNDSNTSQ